MKTRTTTATAAVTPEDHRSSCAIALDETTAWLCERVPDRVPVDVPLLLLAHPSWLSAAAGEYGRRLRAELGRERDFREHLEGPITDLPAKLLQFNPEQRDLARIRREIDEAVELLRNPPSPMPTPAHLEEVAAWLGLELAKARTYHEDQDVRAKNEAMIDACLVSRSGDSRMRQVMLPLRRVVLAEGPKPIAARRSTYVLAAAGIVPTPGERSPLFATEAEIRGGAAAFVPMRRPSTPALGMLGHSPEAWSAVPAIPKWYDDIARDLGHRSGSERIRVSYAAEYAAIERQRDANEFGRSREDNDRGFRAARDALERGAQAQAVKLAGEKVAEMDHVRVKILEAFDVTLAKMPIGIGWYFTRLVRDRVATLDNNCPDEDLEAMKAFGVKLEMAA